MRVHASVLVSLSLLLGACGPIARNDVSLPATSHTSRALSATNGGTLNGRSLNGGTLNGGTLNGSDLGGVLVRLSFVGARVRGNATLDYGELRGTRFYGRHSSAVFEGDEFLLADFPGHLGDGGTVRIRIAQMTKADAPNADLDLYWPEHLETSTGQWKPACYDQYTGAPTWAVPVSGYWDFRQGVPGGGDKIEDPGSFTFACLNGAIAKCVMWGYRPWATYNGTSLAPYHQTCTRVVRADYCGDGMTHTVNGMRINLYDNLNIQQDTENWIFEAEWSPSGARCIHPYNRSHSSLPCYNDRVDLLCGYNLSPSLGALFRNETPSAGLTP